MILGPSVVSTGFTSGAYIRKFMHREMPGMPRIMLPIVDVRDVA